LHGYGVGGLFVGPVLYLVQKNKGSKLAGVHRNMENLHEKKGEASYTRLGLGTACS
jgi:hypothetical protein